MSLDLDFLPAERRADAAAALCDAFRMQKPELQQSLRRHLVDGERVRDPASNRTYLRALAQLQGETRRQLAARFAPLGENAVLDLIARVIDRFDEAMIGRVVIASE